MPPLECANFLECGNKNSMRGPLRLPSTFFLDPTSTPVFFHHIPENYHNSPCWVFLNIFLLGQNGLECDSMWNYRRLTRKLHLPHIPENVIAGDLSKKNEKTKKRKNRKNNDFMECEDLAWVREFYNMCTSLAVECDVPCGVRRILGIRGWYRDHRGKFRGQNQNSNPKASPNFQGHTS